MGNNVIELEEEQRKALEQFTRTGVHSARLITRARVILALYRHSRSGLTSKRHPDKIPLHPQRQPKHLPPKPHIITIIFKRNAVGYPVVECKNRPATLCCAQLAFKLLLDTGFIAQKCVFVNTALECEPRILFPGD